MMNFTYALAASCFALALLPSSIPAAAAADILAGLHDLRVSQGMEPAVRCCLIGCELAIVPHQPPQTGVIQHLACVAALEDTRLGKVRVVGGS